MTMKLEAIIDKLDYKDLFILSRYYYRIGDPLIEDSMYNSLERMMQARYSADPEIAQYFDKETNKCTASEIFVKSRI